MVLDVRSTKAFLASNNLRTSICCDVRRSISKWDVGDGYNLPIPGGSQGEPVGAAEDWKQAIGPWQWSFPRDHGAHPEFRTEWWYFTGNLKDKDGKQYGYQLTFFRQGLAFIASQPDNPWSIRDVYLAHFALVDGSSGKFWYHDRASRTGPGLAWAANRLYGCVDPQLVGKNDREHHLPQGSPG